MRAIASEHFFFIPEDADRKSTRLNSSHSQISYAVFCLKKKKQTQSNRLRINQASSNCSALSGAIRICVVESHTRMIGSVSLYLRACRICEARRLHTCAS